MNFAAKLRHPLITLLLFCISISPFVFMTRILWLKDPFIWPDETVFVDMAKRAVTLGYPSTMLYGDAIPGMTEHSFLYPPVFFYILGAWIRLFGQSIESIRIFPAVWGAIGLVVAFFATRKLFASTKMALASTALLSVSSYFNRSARIARMEIVIWVFEIVSIWLAFAAIEKKSTRLLIFAAITSSLACLMHPIGIIVPAIITANLWLSAPKSSRLRQTLLFIGICLIPILLWTMTVIPYMGNFITQIYFQLALRSTSGPYLITALRADNMSRIWTIINILLFIFAIWQYRTKPTIRMRWLLIGVAVSSSVLLVAGENFYFIYLQPWRTWLALELVYMSKPIIKRSLAWALLTGMVINQIIVNRGYIDNFGYVKYSYNEFSQTVAANLPQNSRVMMMTIPDPTLGINRDDLTFFKFPTGPIKPAAYQKLLNDIDILVINYLPVGQEDLVKKFIATHLKKRIFVGDPVDYRARIIYFREQKVGAP